MPNQTAAYTSQGVNRTSVVSAVPILIAVDISTTTTTTVQTGVNFSNQLRAYKPYVLLLLFYTIIFEKYSRR